MIPKKLNRSSQVSGFFTFKFILLDHLTLYSVFYLFKITTAIKSTEFLIFAIYIFEISWDILKLFHLVLNPPINFAFEAFL